MTAETNYIGPKLVSSPDSLVLGDLRIPYISRDDALDMVADALQEGRRLNLAFCNANTLLMALRRPDYMKVLKGFLVLNDGLGIDLCSWLFNGFRFPDNLNGTDFIPHLLAGIDRPLRIFLLGSKPGIAEEAARQLSAHYLQHRIVGARNGYFGASDTPRLIGEINASGADIVLVGMGNPRQEQFILANRAVLAAPVTIAVGAFLDFTAGAVSRAPNPVRKARLEWVWRLALEPGRLWRRYTIDIVEFMYRIVALRLRGAPDILASEPRVVAPPARARLPIDP